MEVHADIPEAMFVVCGWNLRPKDEILLSKCATRKIKFVRLSAKQRAVLAKLPVRRQLSHVTYARLLLPDLLDDRTGRLLYVDSDIIVARSLRPLFSSDLAGRALGAVPDAPLKFVSWRNQKLGRAPETPYFNAGLQLIDLERWREHELGTRTMMFAKENASVVDWLDQDALNATIGSNWTPLAEKWNWVTEGHSSNDFRGAHVVHFTAAYKPSHECCSHPAKQLYLYHRAHTPWRNKSLQSSKRRAPLHKIRIAVRNIITALMR